MADARLNRRAFLKTAALTAGSLAVQAGAPRRAPAATRTRSLNLLRYRSAVPAEDTWHSEWLVEHWAKPNNVDLRVEFVGQNDLQAKVAVAIENQSGADILTFQWNWAHLFAHRLLDLSDIANKWAQATGGGGWFDPLKAFCMVDGKWRALPLSMSNTPIIYRTDALKAVGETVFPETYPDYHRVSKLVKDKTKLLMGQALGHSYADPNQFCYPFLWSFGGKEVEKDGKTVAINSKETLAAIEFLVPFFKDVCSPEMLGWDDASNNRAYAAKTLWATNSGGSIMLAARRDDKELYDNSFFALAPKGPAGRFHLAAPQAYAIPTYVKDPGPARDLLTFIGDPKVYTTYLAAEGGYCSPPLRGYENDPLWTREPKFAVARDVSFYLWPGWPGPASVNALQAVANFIVVDMFARAVQGTSPKAAAEWAEGELKRIYAS